MNPVVTAAVFSDTHGSIGLCVDALKACRPDVILHLGDHDRDADLLHGLFPDLPLYKVCGNCDLVSDAPSRLTVQLGPVKAFLTHGHLYDVKWGRLDSLVYAAMEAEAQIALFGHTHEAYNGEMGGVKLLNPGAAGVGRERSWALLQVFENGGIACEIRSF